jgi:hypothetical protein
MDCAALQGLTKVPAGQLNAYIQCMEAPAAGVPMQTVSAAQGVLISALIIAIAGSQLMGASKLAWIRTLWGVLVLGIAGLLYSAFNL